MENVILVTVDSLRADHVGCYGYERDTTPNIDAIASEASVFENAFGHACATRPSFPTILTSTYPLMFGGYEQLTENRTLVSEVFDDAGYDTAGFHSNGYLNPEFGYGRGWDTYFDTRSNPGRLARLRQWVKDTLDDDGFVYRTLANAFDTAERHAGANIGSIYVDADDITDHAIDWLTAQSPSGNFLWVHYMDVHHPYVPPAEHQRPFRDEVIDERTAIQLRRKFIEHPEELTERESQDIVDLYDGEIRFTDAEIGRLLDYADDALDEYTAIVTADHGEELRDHGNSGHSATYYDENIHVPLLLSDGEHVGRYDELVGLMDISPTLLDSAGLQPPDGYLGESLYSLLSSGTWSRTEILGDWAGEPGGDRTFAYRDHRWKYIRYPDSEELYDLADDPNEETDLIASGDTPAVIDDLRDAIDAHEADIDATDVDVEAVEMDESVKQQLRDLGYKE